jgi:predicted HTH domain antitoxin
MLTRFLAPADDLLQFFRVFWPTWGFPFPLPRFPSESSALAGKRRSGDIMRIGEEGMKTFTIEIPDHLTIPDSHSDEDLSRAFRHAAAIEWYREGRVSQGEGAEIAGLSRMEFLEALFQAKVPACQVTVDDLMAVWQRVGDPDR